MVTFTHQIQRHPEVDETTREGSRVDRGLVLMVARRRASRATISGWSFQTFWRSAGSLPR